MFWDSFYVAGDDILRNIIQNVVIEDGDTIILIWAVYIARLPTALMLSDADAIAAIPSMGRHVYYRTLVGDLRSAPSEAAAKAVKERIGCIVASRLLWRRQHSDGGSRQALPGGLQHAGVAPDGFSSLWSS